MPPLRPTCRTIVKTRCADLGVKAARAYTQGMSILLVRHAESAANVDWNVARDTSDHMIPITERGQGQARELGTYLANYFRQYKPKGRVRLWCSPYLRTTQTAMGLLETATDIPWEKSGHGDNIFFDEMLRERHYGVLEGYSEAERMEINALHHAHATKLSAQQGAYYARPYGGESPADVTLRLRHFYGSLMRSIGEGVEDHVIVTHGIAIRSFVISFTRAHPLFFEKIELGGNTAVRLIDVDPKTKKYADYGMLYDPDHGVCLEERPAVPILRDIRSIVD